MAATIAALAVVTGAFGGAWLANRNAIAITNKQVESAERTTLRGNRQAAYSDFIEALQEEDRDLTRMASALDQDDRATVEQIRQRRLTGTRLAQTHLRVWLVGPRVVPIADRLLSRHFGYERGLRVPGAREGLCQSDGSRRLQMESPCGHRPYPRL